MTLLGTFFVGSLCIVISVIQALSDNPTTPLSNHNGETEALRLVQNWRPPGNQGMSWEEAYDAIVYVYQNNLGISDARTDWSAKKIDDQNYVVHAALKGETGWADYNWSVNIITESITSLDKLSICPKSYP